jgi:hypothetical protein
MKKVQSKASNEMSREYSIPWEKAVRGKYAKHFKSGCYVVSIDLELREFFPTDQSVNDALRVLAEFMKRNNRRKSA